MGRISDFEKAFNEIGVEKVRNTNLGYRTPSVKTHNYRCNLFSKACKIKGITQREALEPAMDKVIREVFGKEVLGNMRNDIVVSTSKAKDFNYKKRKTL